MEFNKKLQELRKRKGITQEELSEALFVSRTAVSKWESGRGYPNIDSLRAIAKYFSVTVDELLSGDELLGIAEQDSREKQRCLRDRMFGLFDLSIAALVLLPFFAQRSDGAIYEVSLFALEGVASYLKVLYFAAVIAIVMTGICTLLLKNGKSAFWERSKVKLSLILNVLGAFLFIVGLQPYAASFLLVFLSIKVLIITKKQ